ncbi:MAG: ABC transporter permease [Firmicutes bacterium]|nr:ABC transporter permease [Bacillota bacterium]
MRILRVISLAVILGMLLIGLAYPVLTPYHAGDFSHEVLMHPSGAHLLGTDEMGRDIFSMLLAGFRVTLGIALAAALIATFLGTVLAVLCAYYRGWFDRVVVRFTALFIIVPEIVVLLFFASFAKPAVYNTVLAIAFFSWSKVTRIIRARAVPTIAREKIQYTLLLKGNLGDILAKMWRELYPAVATMFVFQCSKAAVYEATLSFFGIGDPLVRSWGRMIRAALDYEGIFIGGVYLWYLLPPIICISLFVVALSFLAFERDWMSNDTDGFRA